MDYMQLLCYFENMGRQQKFSKPSNTPMFEHDCKSPVEGDVDVVNAERYLFVLNLVRNPEQRNLPNPFEISDNFFCICFHFEKSFMAEFLMDLCQRTYYDPNSDCNRIPYDIRVLATIGFLVNGHFEYVKMLDAFNPYNKRSLLLCIPEVCKKIVYFLTPTLISFPLNRTELYANKSVFLAKFGVPNIIGIVDSFLVRLGIVNEAHKKLYTTRQHNTAIKVQVACDQNMRFIDANPRYSGAKNDAYIWRRSQICSMMQGIYEKDQQTWLVADRSYRLKSFLINPYRNAVTKEQNAVNIALKKIHCVMDRAVAVLKARFRCLNMELPFRHQVCADIITSCITLHNLMLAKGISLDENIIVDLPKVKSLRNAHYEDQVHEGCHNREMIKEFLYNNQ